MGAVAIVFITRFPGSPLSGYNLPAINTFGNLGIVATGLAVLGFAYCYIASAPMLLLHTTRAHLGLNPLRFRWVFWLFTTAAIVLVHLVLVWNLWIRWWSYQFLGLLVFLVIVGVQVAMIVTAHLYRLKTISSFYRDLATARASDAPWVSQYVESYRHLREHGNAFSILALEFALAFVLCSVSRPIWAALAIVLWLLPSTYSWFIGSLLEAEFAHERKK